MENRMFGLFGLFVSNEKAVVFICSIHLSPPELAALTVRACACFFYYVPLHLACFGYEAI